MRKIYFAGSIRGGRDDVAIYRGLVEHLKTHGEVLTEHVARKNLALMGEDNLSDQQIHDRDMNWLGESNAIVAEVTQASLGAGYELGRIVERNLFHFGGDKIPILCLYRPQTDKRLSAMIAGSSGLRTEEYGTLEEARKIIDGFFQSL